MSLLGLVAAGTLTVPAAQAAPFTLGAAAGNTGNAIVEQKLSTEPGPAPGVKGSRFTAAERAAFRKRQGLNPDGSLPGNFKKDEAWLKTVRQRLGTGEFSEAGAAPQPKKGGSIVYMCPPDDPCPPPGSDPNAPTSGAGYSYLSYMVQRRQDTSSACGKATVSEMSATVPGPSSYNLAQSTVASYLGETIYSATNSTEEGRALAHFVGEPNFGRSFYSWVSMSDPPSSAQRATIRANLKNDIANYRTPITSGVIEFAGSQYPHLNGHRLTSYYEHWVIVGGWNDNSTPAVWYADSYTGYDNLSVPAKSWIPRNKMEDLIGGWGYFW